MQPSCWEIRLEINLVFETNLRMFRDWNSTKEMSILAPHQEFWPEEAKGKILSILRKDGAKYATKIEFYDILCVLLSPRVSSRASE